MNDLLILMQNQVVRQHVQVFLVHDKSSLIVTSHALGGLSFKPFLYFCYSVLQKRNLPHENNAMADKEGSEGNETIDTKTEESSSETSENDVKNSSEQESRSWKTKIYLLERALEEQQATCNYLREERDTFVAHNRLLRHEVKNIQRGLCVGDQENVKSKKYEKGMILLLRRKSGIAF